MLKENFGLAVLTDETLTTEKFLRATSAILENGAGILIYKRKPGEADYLENATLLKKEALDKGVSFFVYDDLELAQKLDTGLCFSSLDTLKASAKGEPSFGVVITSLEEAKEAKALGAAFLLYGKIFEEGRLEVDKTATLALSALGVPVLLYGGISSSNVSLLAGSGLSGVLVKKALYSLPNPMLEVKRLKNRLDFILNAKSLIKGMLFDIDGVLTDTLAFWQNRAVEYLKQNGYDPGPDLIEIIEEKTLPEQAGYIKHNYSVYDGIGEMIYTWLGQLESYYKKEAKAKEDAKAVLSLLKEKSIALKAYTLNPSDLALALLKQTGLATLLNGVESAWNDKLEPTDTRLYTQAGMSLGLAGENVLVFEDSIFALRAASRAGYKTVALYDPNHSKNNWKLMVQEADLAFFNFTEVKNWLEN